MSVIVLTWERERLLAETLEGVLGQTFSDLEVLVVDNESADGTEAYVRGIADPRVTYLRHANGGNLSVNRDHGLAHAKGEFVAFCDDDDLWEPRKLQEQVDAFAAHPEAALVCTQALRFDRDDVFGPMVGRKRTGWVALEELLGPWHPVILSSVLARRDVLTELGGFDTDPAIVTIEDHDTWVRLAAHGRIWFIAEPLVRYRVHAQMYSHKDLRDVLAKERVLFSRLRERGLITLEQNATAQRAIGRAWRVATVKEALKSTRVAKPLLYFARKALWRLRSRGDGGG
ncbi:MAG: glycosyltransferase [Coriobacteriia bacterium]